MPTRPIKAYKSIHDADKRATPRTAEIHQIQPILQDPTPLDILLSTMRQKWLDGDGDGAAAFAKIAAPYVHPRRTITANSPELPTELHRLTDEDLAIRLAAAHRGAEDPPDDPQQPE